MKWTLMRWVVWNNCTIWRCLQRQLPYIFSFGMSLYVLACCLILYNLLNYPIQTLNWGHSELLGWKQWKVKRSKEDIGKACRFDCRKASTGAQLLMIAPLNNFEDITTHHATHNPHPSRIINIFTNKQTTRLLR